jgi:hypothetical protein
LVLVRGCTKALKDAVKLTHPLLLLLLLLTGMLHLITSLGLEAQQWGDDNQTFTPFPGRKTGIATPSVFEVRRHQYLTVAQCVLSGSTSEAPSPSLLYDLMRIVANPQQQTHAC